MEFLSRFLVQQPLHILGVSSIYFIIWALLRFYWVKENLHPNAILLSGACWLLYAVWEWVVLIKTPEANIRVDLLLIWPVLLLLTIWAVVRTIRA
jgi:hypothetical protein